MTFQKDDKVFAEMVISAVLSLVCASLWIEFTKNMIKKKIGDGDLPLFICALLLTIAAIFTLKLFFENKERQQEEDRTSR